jgi:ABC-type branched-subunit amino acid transport system ATPase component
VNNVEPHADSGLSVRNLTVAYGGLVAIAGVNLEAPAGRITGLIGPNGAGKTTTFNACSGLAQAAEGSVWLHGEDVTNIGPAARARRGLGRTFQKLELFDRLTVRENIELAREATVVSKRPLGQLFASGRENQETRKAADEAIELCGIGDLCGKVAGALSTGQRRLVELAMTLAGTFSVLLLDEPSSGLDPTETKGFGEILLQVLAERGIAILLVEHDMALVSDIAEYLYVYDFGKPLLNGNVRDVLSSPIVAAAYLGSEAVDQYLEDALHEQEA